MVGAPQMRLELRVGDPASEVLDAIDSAGAELVAVGWPQDSSRGAVARRIVDRSPVPVLMIPIV
jgi:nucleotide-binding universal stress UspA family protein